MQKLKILNQREQTPRRKPVALSIRADEDSIHIIAVDAETGQQILHLFTVSYLSIVLSPRVGAYKGALRQLDEAGYDATWGRWNMEGQLVGFSSIDENGNPPIKIYDGKPEKKLNWPSIAIEEDGIYIFDRDGLNELKLPILLFGAPSHYPVAIKKVLREYGYDTSWAEWDENGRFCRFVEGVL